MSETNWPKRYFDLVQSIALACDVGIRLDLPAPEIVARIRRELDNRAVRPAPTEEANDPN